MSYCSNEFQKSVFDAPKEISNHGKSVLTSRPGFKINEPVYSELISRGKNFLCILCNH